MDSGSTQQVMPSPDEAAQNAGIPTRRTPTSRPRFRMHGVPIRSWSAPSHPARAVNTDPVVGLARRAATTAFINRNFALLWWGQAISSIGDYAWDTALVLWIATFVSAGQTWSPLAVAGAILAATIPQIVIGPIAGVFVDRWDKRGTMIVVTAIQTVLAALLIIPVAGLPIIGKPHLSEGWLLGVTYFDIVLLTSGAQFFLPAQLALIKDIVAKPKQDQAIEMTQAIQALAVVIGPPLAAGLVFGLGIEWALALNALTFGLIFLMTRAIAAPPPATSLDPGETGHFSREFKSGVGYVWRHTVLRTILIAEILTWLGFGALQSLGYFFITEDLHAPPSSYGLLGAIFGLGAIVGGVLVTVFGRRIGLVRILWVALVTAGVFVTVMSHLTSFIPALVAAFLFGVAATAILISAGPLSIDATEKAFVGRVTAVINPVGRLAAFVSIILAGALVGTVLSGFHTTIFGITFDGVNTVFTFMGLLAVAGGVYARYALRDEMDLGKHESGDDHGAHSHGEQSSSAA